MKSPSQYHIQKRKDGRYAVTVMFKGKRQSLYEKTKKETLEKLTKVINDIQYAKIHNLQNFSATTTTLSDWATECVETYSKEYVRGSTYYSTKMSTEAFPNSVLFSFGILHQNYSQIHSM